MDARNYKDFYGKRKLCFPYKSLQFCKFLSYHKFFAFLFKSLEFSILPNTLSLFLSLIVLCKQIPFVASNKGRGFWRAKLPRFRTKPSNFLQYSNRHQISAILGIGLKIDIPAI